MDKIENMEIINISTIDGKLVALLSYQNTDLKKDDLNNGYGVIEVPINLRDIQLSGRGNMLVNQSLKHGSIFLQVGMKVKIKNSVKEYSLNAGQEKVITKELPRFKEKRAFGLDGDEGIWCIEDFEYCVEYPHLTVR